MAKLSVLFDANKVKPNQRPTPVPTGKYPAIIVESTMKPTKDAAKKASYLELVFDILSGDFKGQKLWDRLNLVNPNAKAVEIAQGTLSAICHATGVMQVTDTMSLHNKPLIADVVLVPAEYDKDGKLLYDAKNEIRAYEPAEGAPGGTAAPAFATAAAGKKSGPPAAPGKVAPPPAPAPAAVECEPDLREFYVMQGDAVLEGKYTGDQIAEMMENGMPDDNGICLDGDDTWGTTETYKVGKFAPAKVAIPAPASKTGAAPWVNKKK